MAMFLSDALLLAVALSQILFGLQGFLTADRRIFANEMIKAATQTIAGLFLLYLWQKNVTAGGSNKGYYP